MFYKLQNKSKKKKKTVFSSPMRAVTVSNRTSPIPFNTNIYKLALSTRCSDKFCRVREPVVILNTQDAPRKREE
jgi:hypothetical protein